MVQYAKFHPVFGEDCFDYALAAVSACMIEDLTDTFANAIFLS